MSDTTHIFFTAFPAFGHVRPFCVLAARLVKEQHKCVVTMLISPSLLKKAEDEVEDELRDGASEETRKRLRILSSFKEKSADPFVNASMSKESFPIAYRTLLAGSPITCGTRGTVFDAVVAPSVLIMDFFTMPQVEMVRSISGKSIPIIAWVTGDAPSLIRIFGPESYGGLGDIGSRAQEEASRLGVSVKEIGDKIYRQTSGEIIKLPGVSEMYDYEFFPQPLPFEISATEIFQGNYSMLKESDAVLAVNAHALEKPAIDVMKSWFSEWNKDLYAIGPLLPSSYGNISQGNRGHEDIQEFLDNMHVKHGPNSVILMSFGTMFWPPDTTYLEEVVEALIEQKFPFILSHASPFANLSDTFKEKVRASGLGHLASWCPQQYILNHPATGWFLTHCGHNSITESLASGIPMIAWPFEADQPAGALHIVDLNIGIELLEVRSGKYASRPLRRNGKGAAGTREAVRNEIREVIDACRGQKGKEMRANAELMQKIFRKAWDNVDGPARSELEPFLRKYTNLHLRKSDGLSQ